MANMIPISTVTVGSGGASSIDFTNIPQIYTDLLLYVSARNSVNNDGMGLKFNSSTTGYSYRDLYGTGSAAGSSNNTTAPITAYGLINPSTYTASVYGNAIVYIPNYTSSNYKSVSIDGVAENNATATGMYLSASLWSNTTVITSINLTALSSGTIQQYSSATLYGIRKY